VKPPSVHNVTNTAVSTTVSAAIPTGVGEPSDRVMGFVCNRTFDILFSDDGTNNVTPNPTNTGIFLAGVIYTVDLSSRNTHFKVIASGAGILKHWRSSRS